MATSNKRSLLTEVPAFEIRPVLTDIKDARQTALTNAHNALISAFGPKIEEMLKQNCNASKQQITEDTTTVLSMDDLEKMLLDFGMELADDDMVKECRKRLNECKDPTLTPTDKDKMYKDIHRKFWAYVQSLPAKKVTDISTQSDTDKAVKMFINGGLKRNIQWISHEGSMIICSLISVSDGDSAYININQLPDGDKEIINNIVKKSIHGFFASIDQYKNFECFIENEKSVKDFFTIGNRVASIPPNEATGRCDVKIERKGKDILIGDRFKLEKNRIQNLVAPVDSTNNITNRGLTTSPKQKVAGRNAYEIRADILELALDFAKSSTDKKLDTDDILDIAEAFYSFVEHK